MAKKPPVKSTKRKTTKRKATQTSGYNDTRVRSFYQAYSRRKVLSWGLTAFAVLLVGFIGYRLVGGGAAYAYSTLYEPNRHANATLLACKDNNKLRLQYTGDDSPLIRLRVSFGPRIDTTHSQSLKKYTRNWTWSGSYDIPKNAQTVKTVLVFDDYTSDSSGMKVSALDSCSRKMTKAEKEKVKRESTIRRDTSRDRSRDRDTRSDRRSNSRDRDSSRDRSRDDSRDTTPTPAPAPAPKPAPTPTPPAASNGSFKPLTPGTTWQWQLTGKINTSALDGSSNPKKMFDIDLEDTSASTIATLKNKGIVVICYFSAGTSENWRSDYGKFPASVKGSKVDGWAGENWLDVRNLGVLMPIMSARLDMAVNKGCDGVEPDNVDAYTNRTGFPLTAADQRNYLLALADAAHARNLSIGLKNNIDQVSELSGAFDWALNEQCYQYNECGVYSSFISKNKAVFGVEYSGKTTSFCPKANAANFDWLLKDLNLGASPRTACRNG